MTRWNSLSCLQARKLRIKGAYELDKITKNEKTNKLNNLSKKSEVIREIPLEEEEQKVIAEYLDYRYGHKNWCHIPNEGDHKVQYYVKQKYLGVKSGVPDILIFVPPDGYNGIAIEMKRQKGGHLSNDQKEWLSSLKSNGWLTKVAYGANEAISFLESYK